jgi:hypothetical protein
LTALCSVSLSSLLSPILLWHSSCGASSHLLRPLISCTFHFPIHLLYLRWMFL